MPNDLDQGADPFAMLASVVGAPSDDDRQMARSRTRFAGMRDQPGNIAQSFPVFSQLGDWANRVFVHRAQQRIVQGRPLPTDFDEVAWHERREQLAQDRDLGTHALNTAVRAPAIVGEAALGGAVVRGVGGLLPGAAGRVLGGTGLQSLAGRAGGYAVQQTLATPFMPSMYAEQWQQNNEAAGRAPEDIRGLPAALGVGAINNMVLGSIGHVGGAAERISLPSVGGIVARQVARAAAGVGEQAVADLVSHGLGLQAGYGTVQDFAEGRYGDLGRHAAQQAITFSVFGLIHEASNPGQVLREFGAAAQQARRQGLSAQRAAGVIDRATGPLLEALQENPNLGRAEALRVVAQMGPGFARDYARSLALQLPEARTQTAEPSAPEESPGSLRTHDLTQGEAQATPAQEVALQREPERPSPTPTPPRLAPEAVQEVFGGVLGEHAPTEPARLTEPAQAAAAEAPPGQRDWFGRPVGQTQQEVAAKPTSGAEGSAPEGPAQPQPSPARGEGAPVPRSPREQLAELMQRHLAGDVITIQDVEPILDAAGLKGREKEVYTRILVFGESGEEAGRELGVSRERIRQIGDEIAEKLGLDESLAKTMKVVKAGQELDRFARGDRRSTVDRAEAPQVGIVAEPPRPTDDLATAAKELVRYNKRMNQLEGQLNQLIRKIERNLKRGYSTDAEHRQLAAIADEFRALDAGGPSRAKGPDEALARQAQEGPAAAPAVAGQPVAPAQAEGAPGGRPEGQAAAGQAQAAHAPEAQAGEVERRASMGAAAVDPAEPPSAGAPAAAVGNAPPAAPAPTAASWFQRAKDFLASFAQKAFPAVTRLSRESGEKLAQAANAPDAAHATWEYMSNVLKVGTKRLAQLTDAEAQYVGAVWLEQRFRHFAAELRRRGENASEVKTLVGVEGSPLKTEADFRQGVENLWSFFEAVRQEWTPEVEKNFKGLMGIDPADGIDSKSQIPGLPLNAIAMKTEDLGQPGVVGTGRKQGMQNLRLRRPGFTREATLAADAYDVDVRHMMQRTLNLGVPAARRAEFVRQAIADGLLVQRTGKTAMPEGFEYLGLDPARGLPGLDPNSSYYVRQDAYQEVKQGLGIGERPGEVLNAAVPVRAAMDKLYQVALMSPVELSTHVANHFTALFKPGMGTPFANLGETIRNATAILKRDPAVLEKLKTLADMGAWFHHEARPGILGEKLKAYDPTAKLNAFTAKFIETMQGAVRLQLADAYDRVAGAGDFPRTETAKRDFVNQSLGNYSSRSGNVLAQFLKDTGLQSFATAAHTMTTQAVKNVTGGAVNAPTTNTGAAVRLRAAMLVKFLPFLAAGPALNAVLWGQPFPQGVPAFAIQTRRDEDGAPHWFDPLYFTGLRRGARATGINALVEAAVQGDRTAGEVVDRMARDTELSLEHLFAGPPAQLAHTALTGRDATGRQIAPRAEAGQSQALRNVGAAAAHVNPIAGAFAEPERHTQRTLVQTAMGQLGPFGERSGRDAVDELASEFGRLQRLRQAAVRRGEFNRDVERRYQILESGHRTIQQLDHAAAGLVQTPQGLVQRQAPPPDRVRELRARQVEIARRLLDASRR